MSTIRRIPDKCPSSATSRTPENALEITAASATSPSDTTGLLLEILATPASAQDRDAARPLLFNLAHHEAAVYWAMIILMTPPPRPPRLRFETAT